MILLKPFEPQAIPAGSGAAGGSAAAHAAHAAALAASTPPLALRTVVMRVLSEMCRDGQVC